MVYCLLLTTYNKSCRLVYRYLNFCKCLYLYVFLLKIWFVAWTHSEVPVVLLCEFCSHSTWDYYVHSPRLYKRESLPLGIKMG